MSMAIKEQQVILEPQEVQLQRISDQFIKWKIWKKFIS